MCVSCLFWIRQSAQKTIVKHAICECKDNYLGLPDRNIIGICFACSKSLVSIMLFDFQESSK